MGGVCTYSLLPILSIFQAFASKETTKQDQTATVHIFIIKNPKSRMPPFTNELQLEF